MDTDDTTRPLFSWDENSRDRQRSLGILALICATALCLALLATGGPGDAQVEGNERTGQTQEVDR